MNNKIFNEKKMLSAVTRILSPDLVVADGELISPKYIFSKNTVANIILKKTTQVLRLESWTLKRFSQKKKFKMKTLSNRQYLSTSKNIWFEKFWEEVFASLV